MTEQELLEYHIMIPKTKSLKKNTYIFKYGIHFII